MDGQGSAGEDSKVEDKREAMAVATAVSAAAVEAAAEAETQDIGRAAGGGGAAPEGKDPDGPGPCGGAPEGKDTGDETEEEEEEECGLCAGDADCVGRVEWYEEGGVYGCRDCLSFCERCSENRPRSDVVWFGEPNWLLVSTDASACRICWTSADDSRTPTQPTLWATRPRYRAET